MRLTIGGTFLPWFGMYYGGRVKITFVNAKAVNINVFFSEMEKRTTNSAQSKSLRVKRGSWRQWFPPGNQPKVGRIRKTLTDGWRETKVNAPPKYGGKRKFSIFTLMHCLLMLNDHLLMFLHNALSASLLEWHRTCLVFLHAALFEHCWKSSYFP